MHPPAKSDARYQISEVKMLICLFVEFVEKRGDISMLGGYTHAMLVML